MKTMLVKNGTECHMVLLQSLPIDFHAIQGKSLHEAMEMERELFYGPYGRITVTHSRVKPLFVVDCRS